MLFSFVIIAIMLNMFIAIVTNAYDDYKMGGDDLFGLYDFKLSFFIFFAKIWKYFKAVKRLYTENKKIACKDETFQTIIGKACKDLETGGFFPSDRKEVISYIDIILGKDRRLKKFEKRYFEEHACNIKFQKLVHRRKENLAQKAAKKAAKEADEKAENAAKEVDERETKEVDEKTAKKASKKGAKKTNNNNTTNGNTNDENPPASSSSENNNNVDEDGKLRPTSSQVMRALRSDTSRMHSMGLRVRPDNTQDNNNNNTKKK